MQDIDYLRIIQIMNSSLLHDLVSPVGAINMAAEVALEEVDQFNVSKDAIEIINDSANSLSHKLNYFRLAFGSSAVNDGAQGVYNMQDLVEQLFREKSCNIKWHQDLFNELEGVSNSDNLKLILNIFLVIFAFIKNNANVTVYAGKLNENQAGIAISVIDDGLFIANDSLKCLQGNVKDMSFLTPRNIKSYWCFLLAHQLKSQIEINVTNDKETQLAFTLNKQD